MRTLSIWAPLALLLAGPVAAQTVQQDFDAAQKALDEQDVVAARAKFEALLKRMKASKSRSVGVVKSRLGSTLVMDGEQEAAIPLLTEAIAIFDTGTPADVIEQADALSNRARAHEALGQFKDAAADYGAALNLLKPEHGSRQDIVLRTGMARALIWTDPGKARRELDGLIALPADTWGKDRKTLALLNSLRARVDLNDGRPADAMPFLRKAMELAGGSKTLKVDVTDIRVRADAAIAAHLLGLSALHQELVAYSGGGSLVTQGLSSARWMELPSCGTGTGLDPNDVAVVEFAINNDGRVRAATPIYVKRADGKRPDGLGAGPETQFVQAARSWYWQPENLAKVEPFWRQSLRVEVRCSNARSNSDPIQDSLQTEHGEAWARLQLRPMPPGAQADTSALPQEKAELAAREKADGVESPQLLVPLSRLGANQAAPPAERAGWTERALALLHKAGADPFLMAVMNYRLVRIRAEQGKDSDKALREGLARLTAQEAAARPDARMTQFLRLELAEALQEDRTPQEAEKVLDAIVATPEEKLGRVDPIRTAALLRLSNIAAARKDLNAAAAALAATGLSPEQCALVDVQPTIQNRQVSASIFPQDARRWGSGGLTKVEFDIGTDGKPRNARTVMAAPPFVFGPATEKGALQLRYQPVFRPGNDVGCSAMTQNFRFQVAQN
ncbi:energy transducer TonB [Sandaracinobacteroides hominis]|uniref:energy transducer TonB n=1 Tax=Sandaracinobacteroides hominis TaxID=2780086 RepID=UPI0018F4DC1B|nr:energy transducer TonB [Sandaracinobacteroides hominis]